MSTGFSSANLASIFQTSYQNALLGKNALGSTSSLASTALFGSLAPGSNPLAPLQGQTAVMGLSSWVTGLTQSYQARKAAEASGSNPLAGLTGDTTGFGSTSGMSSSDMLSALSSMLGMLGGSSGGSGLGSGLNSSLLNGYTGSGTSTLGFDQTGLGGLTGLNALNGNSPYLGAGSTASAFDVSADQTSGSGSLLTQLQSMLSMLTTMMSAMGGSTGGAAAGSPYSPYGTGTGTPSSLTGANPLSSPTLFSSGVNMNTIDAAINQTLGSISSTLPMVHL